MTREGRAVVVSTDRLLLSLNIEFRNYTARKGGGAFRLSVCSSRSASFLALAFVCTAFLKSHRPACLPEPARAPCIA